MLFIYKAFDIDQGLSFSGHSLLERAIYFALAASVAYAVNELIIRRYLRLNSVAKKIIWNCWEIFSAGTVVFFLFDYFWNFTETHLSSYVLLIGEFASVMLIPHVIAGIVAYQGSTMKKPFVLTSDNRRDKIIIPSDKLMYIKAEDNYVNIYYRLGSAVQSKLLRRKLSDLASEYASLLRVHRSYLVNTGTDLNVMQHTNSIEIEFDIQHRVPVSESYKNQLEALNFHPR